NVAETPEGCRLRAAMLSSCAAFPATRLAQGGLSFTRGVHDCSVLSGKAELGVINVSKCAPPPHQPNPRKSPPFPSTGSKMSIVFLRALVSHAKRDDCKFVPVCVFHLEYLPQSPNSCLIPSSIAPPPKLLGKPLPVVPTGVNRPRVVLP